MSSTRTILALTTLASIAGAVVVAACADDAGAGGDGGPDASPSDAHAGVVDAALETGARTDAAARAPFDPASEPVTCASAPCAVQLVAGDAHFCSRMSDGTVRCWGSDNLGALGRGSASGGGDVDAGWSVSTVAGLSGVVDLSAAGATTCALVADTAVPPKKSISCWGGNTYGQLGLAAGPAVADGDPHPEPAPVALSRDIELARVDVGHRGACAVMPSGGMVCWGSNEQTQLAQRDAGAEPVLGPGSADIGPLTVTRALAASHTMLVQTASGEVWSWGALAAPYGTVGGRVASVSPDPHPARLTELTNVTSLAVSTWVEELDDFQPSLPRAHACAIAGGEVYCWGQTYRAALCTGVPDSERTPTLAPSYTSAWPQQVAVADELTCVRMTDGKVRCCGEDGRGRLGRGSIGLYASSFVEATAFEGRAVHVATSNGAVCALVQGGTVECWGSNENGELGQASSDALDHPSPLPVRF